MTLPALLLALLIALSIGALYHLFRGGGLGQLLAYLGLSILGFGVGHLVSLWLGWDFYPLGQINLGLASVGSLVILLVGDWLGRVDSRPKSKV